MFAQRGCDWNPNFGNTTDHPLIGSVMLDRPREFGLRNFEIDF